MRENEKLVQEVFKNHYKFYQDIGIDIVKSASGHMDQVSADYQGRVLYELLQNAFDRAYKKIVVRVTDSALFVANDGKQFTYNSEHDYQNGDSKGEKFKRYDFQSLCSISTSNKTAVESIGNKGVGFKSVYSLGRYANVHTKGIINPDSDNLQETISFRLYDIFDSKRNISSDFDEEIKHHLIRTIGSIQNEYSQRGVPGYYFPLQLKTSGKRIFEKFDKDIVTVIEVPLKSNEEIQVLLDEIKKIHFNFVSLKYDNQIHIKFETPSESFEKFTYDTKGRLFSTNLPKDKIEKLALRAGIPIKEAKVAVNFKDDPTGLFYNYLPTRKSTPFKYVDFHADFHTTVDRKEINFDGDKVGAYNRALLEACVELYFMVLDSYLKNPQNIYFKPEFVTDIDSKLKNFDWRYIEVQQNSNIYSKVKRFFKINDYIDHYNQFSGDHYLVCVEFLAALSKQYFEKPRAVSKHQLFFKYTLLFIQEFSTDYKKVYSRSEVFKRELFSELKRIQASIIPNISFSDSNELLYRKSGEVVYDLPEHFPIRLFDFEIKDAFVRKTLGIRDFNETNEVLKHFKQCSFSGEVIKNPITEQEQKSILKGCYELYASKREEPLHISNRYATIFTADSRDNHSTKNQANFNVTTLFLKLQTKRYKPAQLCLRKELDTSFLGFCKEEDIDNWLRYLGVATETDYRVVDSDIYTHLKDGLDYIPCLVTKNDFDEKISGSLVKKLRVLTSTGELVHPAIINDNNYSFLKNLSNKKFKPELDTLLVKNYESFPPEYLEILKAKLSVSLSTYSKNIVQFYQSVFEVYAKQGWYLVYQYSKLKWQRGNDFNVLANKSDFELCISQFSSKPILAYYLGRSKMVEGRIISPEKGEISFSEKALDNQLKLQLSEKLPYILVHISNSRNSEANFLSENSDVSGIQEKFEKLQVFNCKNLRQELTYGDLGIDNTFKEFAFDDQSLYLSSGITRTKRTLAVCDYLFANTRIKDEVELILFHKEKEELESSTDPVELELIYKKWKPDYQEKFEEYQKKILANYNQELEDDLSWYIYNEEHQSKLLIYLDTQGKLVELEKRIAEYKNDYPGYFDVFQIQINYNHINTDLALIQTYVDQGEPANNSNCELVKLLSMGKCKKLGIEGRIANLKNTNPHIFKDTEKTKEVSQNRKELEEIQDVEEIYAKIIKGSIKNIQQKDLAGHNQLKRNLPVNHKQIIFQGDATNSNSNHLEITGASGEVEVLSFLIEEFLQLPLVKRKIGIEAIRNELRDCTGNGSFDNYAAKCIEVCQDIESLRKRLIPLMYVAKKFKYSNFDLISFRNNKTVLIEVKTTNNLNNKNLYISIAELNTARGNKNYEIVRVTPENILFLGNPIKKIEDKIQEIVTTGFTFKPRNYQLTLK